MTFISIACIVLGYLAGFSTSTEPSFGQVSYSFICLVVIIMIGLANNGVIVG